MRKLTALLVLSLAFAFTTLANDCGNGKDHGKGTPSCPKKGGNEGNQGGNSGSGGNGGSASGGSSSSTSAITNDNLTSVIDTIHNTNVGVNSNRNSNSNSSNSNSNSSNSNSNSNTSTASASQTQGQSQTASGGNASATGGSSTASSASTASNGAQSNAQNTSFTDVRQTSSAIAPETFPTASCYKTYSGAGQAAGFGFSLGGGQIDKGCTAREDARLLAAMGARVAACKVLLSQPEVAKSGVTLEDCANAK